MTTTISPPIRILGIVGILAAAALGLLLLTHRSTHSSSPPSPSITPAHRTSPSTSGSHTIVKVKPVARPKIVLLPGLPAPVAHALHSSKVVVVSLYSQGASGDGGALAEARIGARSAHAGFAAVNVLNEGIAKGLDRFAGTTSTPTVLIVRRPGRIVNQFDGYADSDVVAQAAQNAGAGH